MELRKLTFKQFETHGEELNAEGSAGAASVALDSGDVQLRGGVHIEVETEDIIIETEQLDWNDKERILSAGETNHVGMKRSDGTDFSGQGFTANIRNRTWGFASGIQGAYIWEATDDEPDEPEAGDETDEAVINEASLEVGEAVVEEASDEGAVDDVSPENGDVIEGESEAAL
jgi:hypothetical protein